MVSVASIGILSEQEAAIFAFRDVTIARELEHELRRTTEFLERILNSAVDGIIAADLRGNILLFNQGAERICGYRAADIIGLTSVKELYAPGVAQEVMRLIRSAEHGGGGRLEPVRRDLITATGEVVPVSISAALVFDDAGREIATVGIFSDLRDRLRMEERLASAQERLAISEKQTVAIELAGAAAHELNQPLTSVMGYAQMLVRKLDAGRSPPAHRRDDPQRSGAHGGDRAPARQPDPLRDQVLRRRRADHRSRSIGQGDRRRQSGRSQLRRRQVGEANSGEAKSGEAKGGDARGGEGKGADVKNGAGRAEGKLPESPGTG